MATATSQSGYKVLKEGEGIGNIVLYNSTREDVREIYGSQYGEINHQSASNEVIYEQLGVSFFFRLNSSVVFSIHVQPPFKGITTQGIVLGESTMRDVFAVYGSSDDWYSTSVHETYWVEYPGIQFHITYKELATPPWVNNEEYLSEKIIRITIE